MNHRLFSPGAAVLMLAVPALAVVTGCAAIPDVTVSYRAVTWSVQVAVVHTVTCTGDGSLVVVDRGATFLPVYSAHPTTNYQLRLKDLDRFFADSDIALALTDDGRLKSINQSTTGQGEAVVKAVIGAAAALVAAPLPAPQAAAGVRLYSNNQFDKELKATQPQRVCAVVRKWSRAAPTELPQVSVIHATSVRFPPANGPVPITPSDDQAGLVSELKTAGLDLSAAVEATLNPQPLQPIADPAQQVASNEVGLTLQQLGTLSVKASDAQGGVGSRSVPVPLSTTFVVPIPKAALFGKQSFSLTLSDAGRVTNVGYGRTTGVPGALGAVSAIAGQQVTEDNAEAASLKAASDLVAQQQRYTNCRLKPAECK